MFIINTARFATFAYPRLVFNMMVSVGPYVCVSEPESCHGMQLVSFASQRQVGRRGEALLYCLWGQHKLTVVHMTSVLAFCRCGVTPVAIKGSAELVLYCVQHSFVIDEPLMSPS